MMNGQDAAEQIKQALAAGWTPDEVAMAFALKFVAYMTLSGDNFQWLIMGMFLARTEPELFAGFLDRGDEQGFSTAIADQLIASIRDKAEAYKPVIEATANASS
jgi:hypothetical protein